MKKVIYFTLIMFSLSAYSSNLEKVYLKELKNIEKVEKRGNNKLFSLIRNSSKELEKDWSPKLAQELARVFNKVLDVNQNYFLVELIEPAMKKRKKDFEPILQKNLSEKNKKLYKQLMKIYERELREGNG